MGRSRTKKSREGNGCVQLNSNQQVSSPSSKTSTSDIEPEIKMVIDESGNSVLNNVTEVQVNTKKMSKKKSITEAEHSIDKSTKKPKKEIIKECDKDLGKGGVDFEQVSSPNFASSNQDSKVKMDIDESGSLSVSSATEVECCSGITLEKELATKVKKPKKGHKEKGANDSDTQEVKMDIHGSGNLSVSSVTEAECCSGITLEIELTPKVKKLTKEHKKKNANDSDTQDIASKIPIVSKLPTELSIARYVEDAGNKDNSTSTFRRRNARKKKAKFSKSTNDEQRSTESPTSENCKNVSQTESHHEISDNVSQDSSITGTPENTFETQSRCDERNRAKECVSPILCKSYKKSLKNVHDSLDKNEDMMNDDFSNNQQMLKTRNGDNLRNAKDMSNEQNIELNQQQVGEGDKSKTINTGKRNAGKSGEKLTCKSNKDGKNEHKNKTDQAKKVISRQHCSNKSSKSGEQDEMVKNHSKHVNDQKTRNANRNGREREAIKDSNWEEKREKDENSRQKETFNRETLFDNVFTSKKDYNYDASIKKEVQAVTTFHKVKEIQGDLFSMPESFSFAHCVAEDMNMGSGIAVQFR